MAGEAQQVAIPTGTTPPPSDVSADSASASTAVSPLAALPSLNPADSPYKPLTLPEAKTPAQHSLPEQEPVQNLGAVSKGGAIAYIADKALRGAVQGYDQSRLQHAQQFNKKMSALSALQEQLGQQYKEAYTEVGSSQPGMTPEQILADPKVKQLHNQLLTVHQTTLDAVGKYLPQLSTDKKTGKQKDKQNLLQRMFGQEPDEALRAYSEAATKLGPTAFYQVPSPQQLAAMHQQRQTAGLQNQAAGATAQTTLSKDRIQQSLYDATTRLNALPTATMLTPNPKGLVTPGNLPIWTRPTVENDDKSHSTELSFSRQDTLPDGRKVEVLVPSIVDGKFMTPDGKMPPLGHRGASGQYIPTPQEKAMQDEAWKHYKQTGQHLGMFDNPSNADTYAEALHNRGTIDDQRKTLREQIEANTAALYPQRKLSADEMKRQDYQSLLVSGQAPKGSDGQPLSYEAWTAYAPAQGRAAAAPPKTPTMKSGIWQGHNVNAYYNLKDHVWMNSDGGQPIPGFAPAPTFAETGLYEPVLTYDPASGHLVSGTFNRRTGETRAQAIGTTGPLSPSVASSIQKNIQPAVEADTRYKIMLDNSIDALKGDQQAMVSLLMNHIGMTLGAQKGTRVAKSIIDEAQASAPWTQRVYAAWGHWDASGDWVYDGYKTGTKLTGQQIHQMIGLAKERRVRQWQQAQEGARAVGVDLSVPSLDTSLSTARQPASTPPSATAKHPSTMTDDEFLMQIPKK